MRIAKHSGKAFIRVAHPSGLPTPFDLTGDPRWDAGGELFERYDLGIEGEDGGDGELTHSLNTSDDGYPLDNVKESSDEREGVKVLSDNSGVNGKKGVEDLDEETIKDLDAETRELAAQMPKLTL